MPEIIIVAGPNGAGKTSFARQYLSGRDHLEFVNADEVARTLDYNFSPTQRDLIAARWILKRMEELPERKASFVVETTLAATGYLSKIESWKCQGFRVTLMFLRLASPDDAVDRVQRRVAAGGHGIPEATIRRRFALGLENLERYYKSAVDEWYIWDSLEGDFELQQAWDDE